MAVDPLQVAPGHAIIALEETSQVQAYLPSLRTILQGNINIDPGASSIGFRAPLSDVDADAFWVATSQKLDDEKPAPHLFWFILTEEDNPEEVLATVQLVAIPKSTHLHRAEVVKLLVRPSAQRRGFGAMLMRHVEHFARHVLHREVLTLDTATATPARAFYNRIGWTEWGTCPEYADFADGTRGDATFFVKILRDA